MGLTREFKLTTIIILSVAISLIIVEAKPFPGYFLDSLPIKSDSSGFAPAPGAASTPVAPGGGAVFSITNYGAKSDGKSDSTMVYE